MGLWGLSLHGPCPTFSWKLENKSDPELLRFQVVIGARGSQRAGYSLDETLGQQHIKTLSYPYHSCCHRLTFSQTYLYCIPTRKSVQEHADHIFIGKFPKVLMVKISSGPKGDRRYLSSLAFSAVFPGWVRFTQNAKVWHAEFQFRGCSYCTA